jgi:hypothetical protein
MTTHFEINFDHKISLKFVNVSPNVNFALHVSNYCGSVGKLKQSATHNSCESLSGWKS